MSKNSEKPTLSLKGEQTGAPLEKNTTTIDPGPPVSESSEPIRVKEEFVSLAGLASQGRDKLIAAMRAHQERTKAALEYVPPPATARQLSQTEREIEAGKRTQARHEAQQASRPAPKRDPAEGTITPEFRPNNLVPDPMVPGTLGPAGVSTAGTREYDPNLK